MNPTPQFFEFEGITFNRNAIQAISGLSVDETNPNEGFFLRIVLHGGTDWRFPVATPQDFETKRQAFLTALTN